MVNRILVDTDVLIDAGRGVEVAVDQLATAAKASILAISVITQMELLVGCRNKVELQSLENFLLQFEIVKLNEVISDRAIDLLRNYRREHLTFEEPNPPAPFPKREGGEFFPLPVSGRG